jgi:hypothetical protein
MCRWTRSTASVMRIAVDAGLVHDRVAAAARDQPAVDRDRDDARDRQRERQAAPEQEVADAGVDRARYEQHDRVVDDLHGRDAQRVRREGDGDDGGERQARAQQRQAREPVAEQEGEGDRERDRGEVREPERGADDHAQHLADRASGQAVQGGADRELEGALVLVHGRSMVPDREVACARNIFALLCVS